MHTKRRVSFRDVVKQEGTGPACDQSDRSAPALIGCCPCRPDYGVGDVPDDRVKVTEHAKVRMAGLSTKLVIVADGRRIEPLLASDALEHGTPNQHHACTRKIDAQ